MARADTNLAVDVVVGGVEDEGNVVAFLGVEVYKTFSFVTDCEGE